MSANSEFLKRFVRQVCITLKKHESAEDSREELQNQLRKVKTVSIHSQKKWLIEKEVRLLEKKIDEVLRHEAVLLSLGRLGSSEIRNLRKDVEALKNKMDRLTEDKSMRQRKISEIENRLRKNAVFRMNASEIERKLRELEQKYNRIKGSSMSYKSDDIQGRINFLRAKVQGIK